MAFSKLLGQDTSSVTPARASTVFLAEVRRLMLDQGLVHDASYAQVKQCEPELFARSIESNPDASPANGTALTNGSTPPSVPFSVQVASGKPLIAGAFHLPVDVDNGVLEAAYRGCGNQFVRVDASKVWLAISVYLMQKTGKSARDTRIDMLEKFPDLAQWAGETKPQPAQASGNSANPFN